MMPVGRDEILEIVREICESMLDISEVKVTHASETREPWFAGRIQIDGSWSGEVRVAAGREAAYTFASRMFDCEPSSLVEDEVRDAVGELVNMVGGNLKNGLSEPCSLSLPTVECGVSVGEILEQPDPAYWLDCDGHACVVHVQPE